MLKLVDRDDNVKEYFISEKFIQSQEWRRLEASFPSKITSYNYTRDYVKYDGNTYYPETTYPLKFSKIIHATYQIAVLSIIKDGGLKPGRKSIPGCTLDSFVWFGMKIGLPEVDELKNYYTMECEMKNIVISGSTDNSAAIDCSSIVNSPCFEPMSRYGEFKLTFEIQNVIDAYRRQFCCINQETSDCPMPEFRMLGTFAYKMETFHTVLVCPPDTPGTNKYPLLGPNQTPVIWEDPKNKGTFIWCPDSTGDKDKASEIDGERRPYRRWEHVTFAFYVPDGKILELNDVSSNLSVCIYLNPLQRFKPSLINDTIKTFLDKVSVVSAIKTKRWLVKLLIRSLRGYLDEEKVFEKMNILDMYKPVDLAAAVYRVEELLVSEEFDWTPLIEWMKDVQQTKNKAVLSSILKYLNKLREICTTKLRDNGVPQ